MILLGLANLKVHICIFNIWKPEKEAVNILMALDVFFLALKFCCSFIHANLVIWLLVDLKFSIETSLV